MGDDRRAIVLNRLVDLHDDGGERVVTIYTWTFGEESCGLATKSQAVTDAGRQESEQEQL